jgi:hypothetical protein
VEQRFKRCVKGLDFKNGFSCRGTTGNASHFKAPYQYIVSRIGELPYICATAFPQNLSSAAFNSAAIAGVSRDSMSRRGIM